MFCTSCGSTLLPDQRFCTSCGTPNPHYSLVSSAASNPEEESTSEEASMQNDASQSVPLPEEETKRKKVNNKGVFKKAILFFSILIILGIGGFAMYKYLLKTSFEKAISSFQNGDMEECVMNCKSASLELSQGKLAMSDSDRAKLVYIEGIADIFQNKLSFLRLEINQLPLKSLENSYTSISNIEIFFNKYIYPESNYGFNMKQILDPIVKAHDSLVVYFIGKSIDFGRLRYPTIDKQSLYVGDNTYLDTDTLLSLIKNPNDSSIQYMIRDLKLKLPAIPKDTILFFTCLQKADNAFMQNQDTAAKYFYEEALKFRPNDNYITIQLSAIQEATKKLNMNTIAARKPEKKKEEKPKELVISFQDRNAITWTNLGSNWSYEITITEIDSKNAPVRRFIQNGNRIEFPMEGLIDSRVYKILIEAKTDRQKGPFEAKIFSLIANGTKLDSTCN